MTGPADHEIGGTGLERMLDDPLFPYVPRLVVDWLLDEPDRDIRTIPGTTVFADISGFTALTERLAAQGKVGAEEMGDLLNVVFEELLTAAYDFGASLLKWGGDAVLLHYDDADHVERAAAGAWSMQETMRRIGRLVTSRGTVRLGMSIGVHTGPLDLLLVGSRHRELVVTGPAATVTARMEKIAQRGQVVISPATALALPARCVGAPMDGGFLLSRPPAAAMAPNRTPKRLGADLAGTVCDDLREHLQSGSVEHEHRSATIGFIVFSGTDELRATRGEEALAEAVTYLIDAVQEAAAANEVTFLATDMNEDGGKIILTAGVPRSRGDDATRMLATLRRIVHTGGRLGLRAGATRGSVFAGDYGPFYRRTYSVAGDMVNLAARLSARAQLGQVLATPEVVGRSRTLFETTPLEPFAVKGKREPVAAVEVGDLRRASEPVTDDRLPLVGRNAELAVLLAAADKVKRGRGAVVDIVGEPGIGKSRLIEELTDRFDARTLWADGDIYGRATPYQPMQRLLRRTLGLPVDVDPASVASALRDLVAGTAPDLTPWLPLIGIAAGVDLPTTPEVERLDPDLRRGRLEAATSDLLGRLLRDPVVFIVNDVHFMDESTLGLVRRLVADAVDRPWLLVLTRRPVVDTVLPPAAHVTTLRLDPLGASAATELLSAATHDNPLSAHRLRQLAERAGGNPMFLTHLVVAATSGADIDVLPDSVEGVVAAQIDRLPARRRRWLRAASVLGMTVDPTLLAGILANSDLADETWSGLEDFIAMNADSRLRFVHHLVRLTAYEGLPYRRRTELHARTALILETAMRGRTEQYAPLLSLHCLNGAQYEAAWRYSRIAGDRARDRYAPAEAAESYRRALAAATHLPKLSGAAVADVCEQLAEQCLVLGEFAAAEQALRQGRVSAGSDPLRLARLYGITARQRQQLGKHGDALRWVSRGRRLLRESDDPAAVKILAALERRGAEVRYEQGAYRAGRLWARRAVADADRSGDELERAYAASTAAVLDAVSGLPVDEAAVREALDHQERAGDRRGKMHTANIVGMCAYFAGNWDTAMTYYAEAERAARDIGREVDAATIAVNRAEVLVQQGRAAEAEPIVAAAVRLLVAAKATSFLSFALSIHGRIALAEGDFPSAMERLGAARAMAQDMGAAEELITADALVAQCLLERGQVAAALRLVDEALARGGTDSSAEPGLHRTRGHALLALGRRAEGQLALRQALTTARRTNSRSDVELSLAALLAAEATLDEAEATAWQRESQELAVQLGIVSDRAGMGPTGVAYGEAPPTTPVVTRA
ncbi:adenylate/guanylate cyclase domain-containing protein [Jatrophihabitans sp.]|uniref:adenylate/guanylate cyclase domain-containing protein n=1 Tax=Jatrophihabitans sp. TaxID=1932789 RepID=UPI003916D9C1